LLSTKPRRIGHRAEVGSDIDGIGDEQQRDDCCEQPRGTVLTQVAGNAAAGGATHAGAHHLHRRHQRVREEHTPGQRIPELRAGLRVGRDAARIVIGRARNQSGAQDPEQPRLARSDHRAVCKSPGCSISKAMLTSVGLPPRCAFTEAAGVGISI
jgi:hypothetical protein